MSTDATTASSPPAALGKPLRVALWIAQLFVAGILGMAAFTKLFLFTPDGSLPLAEALGVGRGVVALIGLVELAAALLVLIPRRHVYGAALATLAMLGALIGHATKIGFSGNPVAEMWPMAVLVLIAALFIAVLRRQEI